MDSAAVPSLNLGTVGQQTSTAQEVPLTSENEARGKWRCPADLAPAAGVAPGVDGEWVLRRGSWPTEELAWPVLQR
jgi:hypothetical protein